MQITITEFVRPNGHQIPHVVFIDDSYENKYNSIVESGCRITIEITSDHTFFLCIEDSIIGDDYVTDIFNDFSARNVITALHTMIDNYDADTHDAWRTKMEKINWDEPPF